MFFHRHPHHPHVLLLGLFLGILFLALFAALLLGLLFQGKGQEERGEQKVIAAVDASYQKEITALLVEVEKEDTASPELYADVEKRLLEIRVPGFRLTGHLQAILTLQKLQASGAGEKEPLHALLSSLLL